MAFQLRLMQISPPIYWLIISTALVLSGGLTVAWRSVRRRRLAGETAVTPQSWIERWWQTATHLWRHDIRTNDRLASQIIISMAALFISLSIGYAYGNISLVDGWQLVTWGTTVLLLVAALLPSAAWPRPANVPWRWLIGIAVVGLLLRLPFLDRIPGGLHVDEMGVAGYTMRHIFGLTDLSVNPFHTANSSQPALYNYIIRLSFALFGYTFTALRGVSSVVGVGGILATYWLVSQLESRRTALITAVLMTTYHFHIHWSRIGLNNNWDTLWVPLVLATLTWGYRNRWSGGAVMAGLALGLSQYFYAGSKIVLFILPFLFYKLWQETPSYRQMGIHVSKMGITAVVVGAPITIFALMVPEVYFERSRVVWGWSQPAIQATIGQVDYGRYLWHQIWRNVGAFTTVPEVTGFYGPGVPYLIGLAAPLFVVGVLWFFWQRQWIPLVWLFFALLFGGILISGAPSSSHHVVMIPVICWATAVPINSLWQRGNWRLALAILALIMATDLFFYFGIYVPNGPRDLFNQLPPPPSY